MSTLRIRDIGNSLGVIIPKTYSDSLGLKAGKEVTIEMKEGALIIKPRKHTLESLVAQMTAENATPEISMNEMGEEVVEYSPPKTRKKAHASKAKTAK